MISIWFGQFYTHTHTSLWLTTVSASEEKHIVQQSNYKWVCQIV